MTKCIRCFSRFECVVCSAERWAKMVKDLEVE